MTQRTELAPAFILPANTDPEERRPYMPSNGKHFSLRELQQAVGGYVESITLSDRWLMLFDEDGKAKRLPLNSHATKLLHLAGGNPNDYVAGDALICERNMIQ